MVWVFFKEILFLLTKHVSLIKRLLTCSSNALQMPFQEIVLGRSFYFHQLCTNCVTVKLEKVKDDLFSVKTYRYLV